MKPIANNPNVIVGENFYDRQGCVWVVKEIGFSRDGDSPYEAYIKMVCGHIYEVFTVKQFNEIFPRFFWN